MPLLIIACTARSFLCPEPMRNNRKHVHYGHISHIPIGDTHRQDPDDEQAALRKAAMLYAVPDLPDFVERILKLSKKGRS